MSDPTANLLRRFGFGAGTQERSRYQKLDYGTVASDLIDYEKKPEVFPIKPFQLTPRPNEDFDMSPGRFAMWWGLRMAMTNRPLQEKLTLFWHDHFAVSASKTEDGCMMLDYMQTLRRHANGNFRTLLGAVAREPAMLHFLDLGMSTKVRPNENFARELMELFTLGIGNYTEADVQHGARALTGWQLKDLVEYKRNVPYGLLIKQTIEKGLPRMAFSEVPALRDVGHKRFLGNQGNLGPDDVFDIVCAHPATGPRLAKALWEWFVYLDPSPETLKPVVKAYYESKYEIKAMLRAITAHPEFKQGSGRGNVKNPVDYVIGTFRQVADREAMLTEARKVSGEFDLISKPLNDLAGTLLYLLRQQGMLLLYPPDVGGWPKGAGWISTDGMSKRLQFADVLYYYAPVWNFVSHQHAAFVGDPMAQTPDGFVAKLTRLLDADLKPDQLSLVSEAVSRNFNPDRMKNLNGFKDMMRRTTKLVFAAPEFQLI